MLEWQLRSLTFLDITTTRDPRGKGAVLVAPNHLVDGLKEVVALSSGAGHVAGCVSERCPPRLGSLNVDEGEAREELLVPIRLLDVFGHILASSARRRSVSIIYSPAD